MKLLMSGDKHLGLISDGMERLEEQERILRRVVDLLKETDPDLYVDLGDLFHTPRPTPAVYSLAMEYLLAVATWAEERERPAYFLVGNHDKPTRGSAHALAPLKVLEDHFRSFRVMDKPEVVTYGEDLELVFLPHLSDWEAREVDVDSDADAHLADFEEDATSEIAGKPMLVFSHLEVPGARMSNDETVQRDTGLEIPPGFLSGKNLVRVYAGHVHKYQEMERVTVVGSALHVDFGEAADPKGVILAEF